MTEVRLRHLVQAQFNESVEAHQKLASMPELTEDLISWSERCADALLSGGTIFFAGNGGSFADAQHLAAELTGKMGRLRPPLAGVALGTNNSSLSAIGNDFGFHDIFSRELEALYRPSSVLIALTTSGNSENILNLVDTAISLGASPLVFTGADGGRVISRCDAVQVPSNRTERIQELHILLGHTLCLLIEEHLEHSPLLRSNK